MNHNYSNTSVFPSERRGDAVLSGGHELQEINTDLLVSSPDSSQPGKRTEGVGERSGPGLTLKLFWLPFFALSTSFAHQESLVGSSAHHGVFRLLSLLCHSEAASNHMPQISQDFVPSHSVFKTDLIGTIWYDCMILRF